ncbi:ubiquitin-specific protease otu1 [Apophysomyces ossiformis]|uniref:Ubiquitin thioesterase OTU n=1 Tax=Apophysomyces ossiformis TaxID=679940 RepID=A0A8H7BLL4_9FUNG|nr:ubiquitin-specific protease otu1 [Apophysomyces ossiformis]
MAGELRNVAAICIQGDPEIYNEAILGKERDKYINWIQSKDAWGGAIVNRKIRLKELSVFSKYFGVEIDSIDVQSGRIDKFGEGAYGDRILVMYSGIRKVLDVAWVLNLFSQTDYDALALAPAAGCSQEFDQTRFSSDDQHILLAAQQLAEILRKQHKYTDVANFTLKCEQCQTGLKGEKDAQNHAKASEIAVITMHADENTCNLQMTGHTNFVEYRS